MSLFLFVGAALAGGVGAAVRYVIDRSIARLAGTRFPWGVVVINVTGSFALGMVVGALPETVFLIGAGFLGGYTTFSTAMLDTVALWRDGARGASVAHALGMLAAGLVAAGIGLWLGGLL